MSQRHILVTAALPYANGHIHLGHLVEYIQTDIWVRFQKLRGERCIYLCADDTHGTAIMIRARQEGRSEEAVIADMQRLSSQLVGTATEHEGLEDGGQPGEDTQEFAQLEAEEAEEAAVDEAELEDAESRS